MLSYTEHGKFRASVQGFARAHTPSTLAGSRQKMTGQALPFPPIGRGFSAMSRIASGSWDAHQRNIRGPDPRFYRRRNLSALRCCERRAGYEAFRGKVRSASASAKARSARAGSFKASHAWP
jgi:hypothetical protein